MTLDEMDVNNVDVTKLESTVDRPAVTREPIFKLAWGGFTDTNDPRGGDTTLTVLGGTDDEAMGIHVLLFPALRPKDSQEAASASPGLSPHYRKAMRQAVTPKQSYFYSTYNYVQDFLLMPSESPYFGGNMDAKAILLLMEAPGNTRAIEARKFPPPHFVVAPELESATKTGNSNLPMDVEAELAATLADMRFNDEPPPYALPSSLWSGKTAIISPELIKLERDAHYKLTVAGLSPPKELSISGGLALSQAKADTQLIKVNINHNSYVLPSPHEYVIVSASPDYHDPAPRFDDSVSRS
jgi:syntaxin-binding protein 5